MVMVGRFDQINEIYGFIQEIRIFFITEMAPTTKSATAKFLLGQPSSVLDLKWYEALKNSNHELCTSLLPFSGKARLPTREQILLLYFAYREVRDYKLASKAIVAEMVAKQTVKYWQMAPIPTVSLPTVIKRVLKLVDEHDARRRSRKSHETTKTDTEEVKREGFKESLKKLFDIASSDAEKQIEKNRFLVKKNNKGEMVKKDKEEDLSFLEDQRGPRVGWMAGQDKVYFERTKEKEVRDQNAAKSEIERKVAEEESRKRPKMTVDDTDGSEALDDEDYVGPQSSKKVRSATVTVELPRNPWKNPETTAMMDRLKLTPAQSMGFFSSIIKTGTINNNEVDLNEFTCSVNTIARSRNRNRGVLFQLAQEEFSDKKPEHCNLHWDGKQLTSYLGGVNECEAILVSGSPSFIEGKLLDVSRLDSSSGEAQFEAVKEQVLLWDIKDNIRSFTWDTTSSNTGVHKGCCTRIEQWLGRPVMWYGCRHHIPELIGKAAWYTLFKQDLKPTVTFFEHIKSAWEDIDKEQDTKVLEGEIFNKEVALLYYQEVLAKKNQGGKSFLRDDYKELVETSMVLLGLVPTGFTWKKPGAAHKARFCAFGLYINKALAFSEQLGLEADVIVLLIRVATFITTLYVPYFISASMGCDAPYNDLEMFKKLKVFANTDPELANSALEILCRHTWYLQEETVPFSLFSKKLSEDEKSQLAAKLLTFESQKPVIWGAEITSGKTTYDLGKPVLELNLTTETRLVDLLGSNSFLLWDILGLDWEWLKEDPSCWEMSTSYQNMKEYVLTVKVTNDCAERGVKVCMKLICLIYRLNLQLITDYASILTEDEEMRSLLLQGVERCRKMFPNFTKLTLNN